MASSTIFANFNKPNRKKALLLIVKEITEGVYKDQIAEIRKHKTDGNNDSVDRLKRELPVFTTSGTFEGGRKIEYLTMYSGFVHLDFNKLSSDLLASAKSKVEELPTTFACFTSPSGQRHQTFY